MSAYEQCDSYHCFACGVESAKLGVWVQSPAVQEATLAACPACAKRFETEPEYFAKAKNKADESASKKLLPLVLELLDVSPVEFAAALFSLEKQAVSFSDTNDALEKLLGLKKGAVERAEQRAIAHACAFANPPDELRRLNQGPRDASQYN